MKPHRIAAGGVILKENTILLVRYLAANNKSYLVGPGGALELGENVIETIIRETMEETGVTVRPHKVLFIEDLLCTRFKMCKFGCCAILSAVLLCQLTKQRGRVFVVARTHPDFPSHIK